MSGPTISQQAQKVSQKFSAGQEIAQAHAALNPDSHRIDADSTHTEQLRGVAELSLALLAEKTERSLSEQRLALTPEFPQTRASESMYSVLALPVVSEVSGEQGPKGFLLPAFQDLHRDNAQRSQHTGEPQPARGNVATIFRLHSDKFQLLSAEAMVGFAFSDHAQVNTLGKVVEHFPITVLFSSQAFKEATHYTCAHFQELTYSQTPSIENENLLIESLKRKSNRRDARPQEKQHGASLGFFAENAHDYLSGFIAHEIENQICRQSVNDSDTPSAVRILRVSERESALSVVIQFAAREETLATLTIICGETDRRLHCEWTE